MSSVVLALLRQVTLSIKSEMLICSPKRLKQGGCARPNSGGSVAYSVS